MPLATDRSVWPHATPAAAGSHLSDHNTLAAQVNALAAAVSAIGAPVTFNQGAYATTLTTMPGAITAPSMLLLSDVISSVQALYSAANENRRMINAIVDVLQAAGLMA